MGRKATVTGSGDYWTVSIFYHFVAHHAHGDVRCRTFLLQSSGAMLTSLARTTAHVTLALTEIFAANARATTKGEPVMKVSRVSRRLSVQDLF